MNPTIGIWKKRLSAHIRTVAQYTSYAGRSGLFLFLLIVLIASSYMYGKAIALLPETFPYTAILTCWLTPFIAVSPIRTLLREADLVFLLPMEARMGAYFRKALQYSFITQAFAVLFAVSASMQLYRHGFGTDALSFIVLVLFALSLKFANLLGGWAESSFARSGQRALFRSARWLADALILYTLYRYGLMVGCLAWLAAFACMSLWGRLSRRLTVNWSYLRLKEIGHKTAMLLFFSSFIDVDELPNRVKQRRVMARLANLVPFRQTNAFHYLYVLTLLRSELFGILLRLTLLAFILLLAINGPFLYAAVYMLFVTVTNVQLETLGRLHRHSVWPALYPLQSSLQTASAAQVVFAARLAQAVLLSLPMLRPAVFELWLLALPLAGVALAFALRLRAGRIG